eukprot:scaffold29845_cov69-Phaeocystis_antarctica.AAC.2
MPQGEHKFVTDGATHRKVEARHAAAPEWRYLGAHRGGGTRRLTPRGRRADRSAAVVAWNSSHELFEDGVLGLVEEGVARVVEDLGEVGLLAGRHAHAGEHLAHLAAVVAVVQQRDVPVAAQLLQEGGERAGRLGELEADDALARDGAGAAAREVARVSLGEVVARDVRRLYLDLGELLERHVDERLVLVRRVPVDELRHEARLHGVVHTLEGAVVVGGLEREERLRHPQ